MKGVLDSIQYEALRICAHAKQGTSLKTLQVEFGEMPHELRREMLSIRLRKRIESIPNYPMKEGLIKITAGRLSYVNCQIPRNLSE